MAKLPSPEESRKTPAGKSASMNRAAGVAPKRKAKGAESDTTTKPPQGEVTTENQEGAEAVSAASASPESFPVGSRVWCVSSSMYLWRRGWVRDHRDGSLSVGVEFDFDRGNIVPFSPRELQILP
jgi:hypothetical protein